MAGMNDRVVPLDRLDDFEVADGQPDVRGWEVVASDQRKIGEVDNLLVDTDAMKVRYLDIDLDDSAVGTTNTEDRHILVPIGYAMLDRDSNRVVINAVASTDLAGVPRYQGRLTPEYETELERRFSATPHTPTPRASTERADKLTLSEEELMVGKRNVAAGQVEIEKEVETEHVRRQVPVTHEEVVVERRPATAASAQGARIEEDEIRVPLQKEELVVGKRTVPKEEIVVRKREVVENKVVDADLRRERAEIHRDDQPNRPDRT